MEPGRWIVGIEWFVVLMLQRHLARALGGMVWSSSSAVLAVLVAVAAPDPAVAASPVAHLATALLLGPALALAGQALAGAVDEAGWWAAARPLPLMAAALLRVAVLGAFAAGLHHVFLQGAVAFEEAAHEGFSADAVAAVVAHAFVLAVVLATPAIVTRAGWAFLVRLAAGPWPGAPAGGGLRAWAPMVAAWLAVAAAVTAFPDAYGAAVFPHVPGVTGP